jgi:undecaprenyl-diphosphatase
MTVRGVRPVPWPVLAAAAGVLAATWLWVVAGPEPPWSGTLLARAAARPLDAVERLSLGLSYATATIGNAVAAALLALALVIARRPRAVAFLAGALIAAAAAVVLAKRATRDPRPLDDPLGPASGYGFPSAHASSWAALVVVAWCVAPSPRLRAAALVAGVPLVLAIAASRVHLGAHAPADIAAGAALGVLVAGLASRVRLAGRLSPRPAPPPACPGPSAPPPRPSRRRGGAAPR